MTYSWSLSPATAGAFSDSTAANPTITAYDNGAFEVSLVVTDALGASSSAASAPLTVTNVPPTINNFQIVAPTGPACQGVNNSVRVSFSVSDPADNAHDPITGTINWGDGSTPQAISGRSIDTTHLYAAGTYTISVCVNYGDGGTATAGGMQNVTLLYSTGMGILQPINHTGPRSAFKKGSTIPVKIRIIDCGGNAVGTLSPKVSLRKVTVPGDPDGTSIEDFYSTVPDQGQTMRFSGGSDSLYIYNLATKNLAPGNYEVTISDPTIASVTAFFIIK